MSSLFQPAAQAPRYLKVLLHGGPGTGKTRAALSFPGPLAVLDLEGGTALYPGDYAVLRTKDLRVIEQAVGELARGGYSTIVVDPLTVLWHLLQDAGQALVDRRKDADSLQSGQALSPREWGLIKRKYNSLLTRLVNLPIHVVLTSRDSDQYEGTGDQLRKIGVKADVEKGTAYLADFVLALQTEPGSKGTDRFIAVVEKSRSDLLPKGARLDNFTADSAGGLYTRHLARLTASITAPAGTPVALDEDAAVAQANAGTLEDPAPPVKPAPFRSATPVRSADAPTSGPAQAPAVLRPGDTAEAPPQQPGVSGWDGAWTLYAAAAKQAGMGRDEAMRYAKQECPDATGAPPRQVMDIPAEALLVVANALRAGLDLPPVALPAVPVEAI